MGIWGQRLWQSHPSMHPMCFVYKLFWFYAIASECNPHVRCACCILHCLEILIQAMKIFRDIQGELTQQVGLHRSILEGEYKVSKCRKMLMKINPEVQ